MGQRLVTVSGLPGSGTSTVCRLLEKRLGWSYINAGGLFRQAAAEAGLSLAEFGQRAENDPSIDRALDARMVELARHLPRAILEARLSGWLAQRHGLPARKVWLAAELAARAARVGAREGQTTAQAGQEIAARQRSEGQRYMEYYDIDQADLSIYDLVVDTQLGGPGEIADRIVEFLELGERSL